MDSGFNRMTNGRPRHLIRRIGASALLVVGLFIAFGTLPANATIHEIVSSHCSFDHRGQLDPPGQTPDSIVLDQSDLRALLATGVYDENSLRFGKAPSINLGPVPDSPFFFWGGALENSDGSLTIVPANIDHPSSKFSWDGATYVGPIPVDLDGDEVPDVNLYTPALQPDHPSLTHCKNLQHG